METAKGSVEVEELTKLGQSIARRVAESKATIPHLYADTDVDAGELVASGRPPLAAVVRAAALALRDHPRLNASYRDGKLERYSRVNVGIAVPGPDGVLVPTIFDADRKAIAEVETEASRLADGAQAGTLAAPDMAGGTFTVIDASAHAVRTVHPVIPAGQAGALAIGGVADGAVARGAELALAPVMRLGLACDHRIVTVAEAAAFLQRVKERLEEPGDL